MAPRGEQMDYKTVILEKKDGLAVLTLNRPDVLNSVNMEMRSEIAGILDSLEVDPAVRLLIVTGAGRAFCSGADIRETVQNPDMAKLINKKMVSMARLFYEFEKPVIGAINGVSAGDGSQWVLAFDLNIASEKARFGWPATYLGIL
jgi:enoyl-CoA hydratase/carnithine racemase